MADKVKVENSKIDALYQWLSSDLKTAKTELMNELKMSSAQIGSLYKGIKEDKDASSQAIGQEIRFSYKQNQNIYEGIANLIKKDVAERLDSVDEKLNDLEKLQSILDELNEIKETCQQLQSIYEELVNTVEPKLESMATKEETQQLVEESVSVHSQKVIDALPDCVDYARISDEVGDKLLEILNDLKVDDEELSAVEDPFTVDYDKISGDTAAKVIESMPYPDQVDYNRIDDCISNALSELVSPEVIADAVAEKLGELTRAVEGKNQAPNADEIAALVQEKISESAVDADSIADMVATKVVVPNVDIEAIAEAVEGKMVAPDVDELATAVAEKLTPPEVDYETLATAVAQKLTPPEVDYDALAESVAAKLAIPEVDYDAIANTVLAKLAAKGWTADVILDEDGIARIADTVADRVGDVSAQAPVAMPAEVDYDRVADIVEDKLEESLVRIEKSVIVDEAGVDKIITAVTDELKNMTLVCDCVSEGAPVAIAPVVEEVVEEPVEEVVEEVVEEPVEEVVEEVVEEPVEEVVEEVVEEPVEEVVEEVVEEPVEEVVEEVVEEPVEEVVEEVLEEPAQELAVAAEPVFEEDGEGQLIDAETGLVVRLKRSFTAKMKQSDEQIKGYYSDLKNELTSYKRINSNVSWHGDRFNFGRETVAKIGINGKTLCFYLALDPNDPELKTTVYHQKDVGAQKAYESTPFLMKVKSDAASKKALRLVGILAEKLGTGKEEEFQETDYVAEFAYESTKSLFEAGEIKATKEKKSDFNF